MGKTAVVDLVVFVVRLKLLLEELRMAFVSQDRVTSHGHESVAA